MDKDVNDESVAAPNNPTSVNCEALLQDAEERLGVLTALGDTLRTTEDVDRVLNTAMARLGRYLGASRCLYSTFDDPIYTIAHEYLARGKSLLGSYNVSERGKALIVDMVGANQTVVISDVKEQLSSDKAAHWAELEVRSLVFCPLVMGGNRHAAVVVHKTEPHLWSGQELLLIEEVVSRCWVVLEQRQSQARLKDTQSLLQIASRLAKVGGWIMELPSQRVHWAGEAEGLFGFESGVVHGQEWVLANVPEEFRETLHRALERCISQGEPFDIAFQILAPKGRTWLRSIAQAERGADGTVTRVLGAFQNIEEQRRLEEQWRQTQKLEAVGHLAGGIAHDFNNLLSVILGYTALILEDLQGDEMLREDLMEIHRAGERAKELTRQLLAFSRRQMLELTVLDVGDLIADMRMLLTKLIGESRELVLEIDPRAGLVAADRGQIEQVIMNLAVNARDAMEAGGRLLVGTRAETVDAPPPDLPELAAGEYVVFYVEDTGKGLDEHTKERMFEPFFTTKAVGKGTGLGLSTALGIIKQSRGQIRVLSQPGEGARFEIYLPVTEQLPEAQAAEEAPSPKSVSAAPVVLLVEDELPVRKVVLASLRRAGYKVLESQSSTHAMSLAKSYPGEIDLVLTDVVMPGLTGPQVVAELLARRPGLKVLYMSGYVDEGLLPEDGNSYHVLSKPFTPDDLIAAVESQLTGSVAAAPTFSPEH